MAQEGNGRHPRPVTGAGDDTARIREQIEHTREHMSGTIGELQERLRPEHLIQQAGDAARDAVEQKVRVMMDTASNTAQRAVEQARSSAETLTHQIQSHPVTAAMAVAGLAWWMARERDPYGGNGAASAVPTALAAGALGYYLLSRRVLDSDGRLAIDGEDLRAAGDTVREGARQLGETAEDLGRRAQATAGEYAEQIGEKVRHAGQTARARVEETTATLRHRRQELSHTVDRWLDENPLAIGAAAVAFGVIAGLSLPTTDAERRAASSVMPS